MGRRVMAAALCVATLWTAGCATAKYMETAKQTRSKNPHAALEYLALVLKEDAANKEAIDLANEIGKEIAAGADTKVRGFEQSKKYAQAVAVCDRVIATRDFLKTVPGNIDIFVNEEERPRLAKLAADDFYARADQLCAEQPLSTPTAMKAAIAFRRSMGFVSGYKDAQKRYEDCRKSAMTNVAFGKFTFTRGTDFLVPRFQGNLKEVITAMNPEFLQISGNRSPETNALLTATIDAAWGDTGWKQQRQKNTVNKSRQIGTDEKGNPLYEDYTVTATWVVYTRTTSATLNLRYEIKDLNGGTLDSGSGRMKMSDTKQWAGNFGGDTNSQEYQDAVPYEVQQLPKQQVEPANFEQLCNAMSEKWAAKDQPLYSFGHKIYTRFSGQRGN
ncbi:MAG: hypothetical protein AB7N76_08010 [Planctomycetota bacterium]